MGDPKRFREFARTIRKQFPKAKKVADVAGGKGYLQTELRPLGFDVITYDKRKGRKDRPNMRYKYGLFDHNIKEDFDLLVGMHPDGATDVIIEQAAKRGVPFMVVPCCAIPTATRFLGSRHGHEAWYRHLKRFAISNGFIIQELLLKIRGQNKVLIGRL